MIGCKEIYHISSKNRIKNQLYEYTNDEYSEVFESLVLSGCHSVLVDLLSQEEGERTMEEFGHIFETDGKCRLMSFLNKKAKVYEKECKCKIYHLALENDDYYGNYGIYANGLLVESCSKRYLKELSEMDLLV